LRYAAGAIGWESPEIQARIERLRAVEASWREKCAAKVAEMAAAAPPAGSWQPALGREARVARVVCGREAVRMLGANAQSIDADCVVELELRDRAGAARAQGDGCLGPRPWTLYAYRRDGSYSSAFLFARADDSKLVPCEQAPGASRALVATTRYRGGDVMSQIMSSRHPPAPAAAVLLVIETIERGPAAKALLALPTGPSPPSAPPPAHPPDRAGTPTPDP
jgi:hypothetical protein